MMAMARATTRSPSTAVSQWRLTTQRGTGRGARGAEAGPAKSGVDSVATGLEEGPDSGSILSTGGICRLLRNFVAFDDLVVLSTLKDEWEKCLVVSRK